MTRHGRDTPAELQPTSDICVKQLLIASWFVLNSLWNKSPVVYWSVYEINLRLFTGNSANIYIEKVL